MSKIRLDQYLCQNGLVQSRERAKALIMSGIVFVNEQNLVELNSLTCLNILDVMYEELLALLSLELLTVNFYDCVHSIYFFEITSVR